MNKKALIGVALIGGIGLYAMQKAKAAGKTGGGAATPGKIVLLQPPFLNPTTSKKEESSGGTVYNVTVEAPEQLLPAAAPIPQAWENPSGGGRAYYTNPSVSSLGSSVIVKKEKVGAPTKKELESIEAAAEAAGGIPYAGQSTAEGYVFPKKQTTTVLDSGFSGFTSPTKKESSAEIAAKKTATAVGQQIVDITLQTLYGKYYKRG